ncbi:MAG: prepilin-type N-terminal cleavage/methylation domain-containing protein [Burkholderiaceae bacterium]
MNRQTSERGVPSTGTHCAGRRSRGFTLIELLVALAVMAMLAMLSWRSIESMNRAQTFTKDRSDQVLRLQAALGQWRADLDALVETGEVDPLSFDGRVLRMTRRDSTEGGVDSPGLRVVAWARLPAPLGDGEAPHWQRWESAPLRQRNELARAWTRAQQWGLGEKQGEGADPRDTALALIPIDDWSLSYHRGSTWGNPLSSVGNEIERRLDTSGNAPNGVRLRLTLSAGQGLAGPLELAWIQPTLTAGSP